MISFFSFLFRAVLTSSLRELISLDKIGSKEKRFAMMFPSGRVSRNLYSPKFSMIFDPSSELSCSRSFGSSGQEREASHSHIRPRFSPEHEHVSSTAIDGSEEQVEVKQP